MKAGFLRKDPRSMFDGAALGIWRRIIEPRDSGVDNGASTHRTGFERHPQITIVKSLVADNLCRSPDRNDFGMGRRIEATAHCVDAGGDDGAVPYHDSSDRYFTRLCSQGGKIERCTHKRGKDKAHFLCHSVRPVLTKGAMGIRGACFPE